MCPVVPPHDVFTDVCTDVFTDVLADVSMRPSGFPQRFREGTRRGAQAESGVWGFRVFGIGYSGRSPSRGAI